MEVRTHHLGREPVEVQAKVYVTFEFSQQQSEQKQQFAYYDDTNRRPIPCQAVLITLDNLQSRRTAKILKITQVGLTLG